MKDLIVTTACTHRYGMIDILERQLDEARIDFYVGAMERAMSWKELMRVDRRLRDIERMVGRFASDYRFMVFIDSRDMLFVGTRDDVIAKIPENGRILMAGDRHCWPEEDLADKIPERGIDPLGYPCVHSKWLRVPWRFANFGGIAGRIEAVGNWIAAMRTHPQYEEGAWDQAIANRVLAADDPFFDIDYRTELFYCMHRDEGELYFGGERPYNRWTGNYPNFIHFNGPYANPKPFLKALGYE
jgi:hypothetical protein